MIIYQDTKAGFVEDIAHNYFAARRQPRLGQVAIEYHCSPIGRSRIDVLLAGSDGRRDNALIIELKAWDKADATGVENMVYAPIAGGMIKQHPNQQARQYKGMIMRFNEDIVKQDVALLPSA